MVSAAVWVGNLIRWAGATTLPGSPTASIQRPHTLADTREVLAVLAAASSHLAGAASLTCSAPGLRGTAVQGMQVRVGGITYTVTADAVASGGEVALAIDPVLAAPVAEGDPITITRAYGSTTWDAYRPTLQVTEDGESERVVDGATIHLAIGQNAGIQIAPGQLCTFDGRTRRIEQAELVAGSRWEIQVGEGS